MDRGVAEHRVAIAIWKTLHWGKITQIAKDLGVTKTYVSQVLYGHRYMAGTPDEVAVLARLKALDAPLPTMRAPRIRLGPPKRRKRHRKPRFTDWRVLWNFCCNDVDAGEALGRVRGIRLTSKGAVLLDLKYGPQPQYGQRIALKPWCYGGDAIQIASRSFPIIDEYKRWGGENWCWDTATILPRVSCMILNYLRTINWKCCGGMKPLVETWTTEKRLETTQIMKALREINGEWIRNKDAAKV